MFQMVVIILDTGKALGATLTHGMPATREETGETRVTATRGAAGARAPTTSGVATNRAMLEAPCVLTIILRGRNLTIQVNINLIFCCDLH